MKCVILSLLLISLEQTGRCAGSSSDPIWSPFIPLQCVEVMKEKAGRSLVTAIRYYYYNDFYAKLAEKYEGSTASYYEGRSEYYKGLSESAGRNLISGYCNTFQDEALQLENASNGNPSNVEDYFLQVFMNYIREEHSKSTVPQSERNESHKKALECMQILREKDSKFETAIVMYKEDDLKKFKSYGREMMKEFCNTTLYAAMSVETELNGDNIITKDILETMIDNFDHVYIEYLDKFVDVYIEYLIEQQPLTTVPSRVIRDRKLCGFAKLPYDDLKPYKISGEIPDIVAKQMVFENCRNVLLHKTDIHGQIQECIGALQEEIERNPCNRFQDMPLWLSGNYRKYGIWGQDALDEVNKYCSHILSTMTDSEREEATERFIEALRRWLKGMSAVMTSFFGK